MMLTDRDRIPLTAAHSILATFGITRPTQAYERWVHSDGFDVRDFDSVLFESQFVFVIDWRDPIDDVLPRISDALRQLEVVLQADCGQEAAQVWLDCQGRTAVVEVDHSADDSWNRIFAALQSVMPQRIQFRGSPFNEGGDTLVFAVLPCDEWSELERTSPDVISYFFTRLPHGRP